MFVMFSMARSATNTACYLINSLPDTYCDDELLNRGRRKNQTGQPLDKNPLKSLQTAFEAAYSSSGKAPCTWGFRLFPQHVSEPWLLDWLWMAVDAAIVLERANGNMPRAASPSHTLC